MKHYHSAQEAVAALKPQKAVICYRPHALKQAAQWFLKHFNGQVLYAVKANNDPLILETLFRAGITSFDVAALQEIRDLSPYKTGSQLFYMNPFKPRHMIAKAFHQYGVKDFVLDSQSELTKIIEETTRKTNDLNLHVRISISNRNAAVPLEGKFGIPLADAPALLQQTHKYTDKLGLCFHVGSQCLRPESYSNAIKQVDQLIEETGISLHSLDIGGGFPVYFGDTNLPENHTFMQAVHEAIQASRHLKKCRLLAEPGRALVAECQSLIVQVIHRKGQILTINDGAFGCLFEGSKMYYGLPYPIRAITTNSSRATPPKVTAFSLQGPSCDSSDFLPGPYMLPASIEEGDYLEIGNIGAYGTVLASQFNGFGDYHFIQLADNPMHSRYV